MLLSRTIVSAAALALGLTSALPGQLPTGKPSRAPNDSEITARVEEYMARLAGRGYTGGVLVVRDGTPIVMRSYGMANVATGIRADTATVYSLGSITKQFTAAAILRLEELGKLRTTDSIGRFFPEAPPDKRAITLHQLLTHTAGFPSDFSPTDYEPTTRAEYVRRMFAAPLRSAPGTTFSYANSGYSLLAAIVEIVTAKEYEAALTDLVLRPAGMLETGYTAPHWAPSRIAHGYRDGQDWGTIVDRISKPGAPYWAQRGNGGLQTTLGDMLQWDGALNDRRMLTDSSRRKFMTGYVNEGPLGRSQYAYGWAVMRTATGRKLVTHNGGNGVYVAELLRFVDDGITVFVTSTVSEHTATPVAALLTKIVFGDAYALPPERAAAASGALTGIAGRYALPDGSRLTLRVKDGAVQAEAVGQMAFQLLASGDTVSPTGAAELNASARTIVEAVVRGDVRPLRRALGPGGPDSSEVAEQEAELLASRLERFGTLGAIEVLGTALGPEGERRTTVRISFSDGAATNLYTWDRAGRIIDLGARPYAQTELLAAPGGEWRTYDERSGGGARFIITDGSVTALLPRNERLRIERLP